MQELIQEKGEKVENPIPVNGEEDKKITATFVGKNYVPYMVEMKKQGFSKTFAYLVLQQNGNKTAENWLVENERQSIAFINWAKDYR